MHSDLALYLYLAIAAGFAFAFGWLGCAIIAGRRERLDALELAERADVNGQRLLVIARGLRDTPAPVEHRQDLDRWAKVLEDIARAHLECINAIHIESLHQVNPDAPVYLGDFVPSVRSSGARDAFQGRVAPWMLTCFGPEIAADQRERADRLLEEVLELLQSGGYDPTRVATLTRYVYGRPVGEPDQEVGGVMVTLAAYCCAAGLDMHQAGERELARIMQPHVMDKIRRKQESKRGLHTPLPTAPGAVA
jgi:hypothetical protein